MAKIRATNKQRGVVKLMSENVGISVSKAMRLAGYSPTSSLQPQRLTKSASFQELANKMLSDDRLIAVAEQGLNADKVQRYQGKEFKDPDYYARHLYLQTALKIRNLAQTADTPIGDVNIQVINYGDTKPQNKPINIEPTPEQGGEG